jgi:hypothetical protein
MWKRTLILGAVCAVGMVSTVAKGQAVKDPSSSSIVTKMMAMDKNKDGKLTKDEITDERLMRLFDEADSNHDGVVTKEELTALAAKLEAEVPAGSGRGGPGGFGGGPGQPSGFDGPPDGGPGGPGRGGPGGRGGFAPPQPGQVLPRRLQDELKLTDNQKKQVAELQSEVDAKLAKILTSEQMTQMKQMRGRGPSGPRGFGGPGGQGGRGQDGPPPGGQGGPGQDRQPN